MRISALIASTMLPLAACGGQADGPALAPGNESATSSGQSNVPAGSVPARSDAAKPGPNGTGARWDLQSSGEGTALALLRPGGPTAIRLFCPAGEERLLVNVPDFNPIGSEERLSFGTGGEAMALVADTRGDAQRGGVSGTGEVPRNLQALVGGRLSASYGSQKSGPHPAPPQHLSRAFVTACSEGPIASPAGSPPAASANPCMMQGRDRLTMKPLRAVGTEPFWGARIEGRCVTFSHPENQNGTRVWTRYTAGSDGDIWSGALGGRLFRLRTRTSVNCSDGMSDKRYPLAVELVVHGEQRRGCAERL